MNQLPLHDQVRVISLLTEGMSIASVSRITEVHRGTIRRLSLRVGNACHQLHDRMMRDLQVSFIEIDETYAFIHTRQDRKRDTDPDYYGDCYLWLAIDPVSKVVISYLMGKRTAENAQALLRDVRRRVINRPQITTDGFSAYMDAVDNAFGTEVDYASVTKEANFAKTIHQGHPNLSRANTTFIERCNLTVRMHLRRHTRRTNAHSKTMEGHQPTGRPPHSAAGRTDRTRAHRCAPAVPDCDTRRQRSGCPHPRCRRGIHGPAPLRGRDATRTATRRGAAAHRYLLVSSSLWPHGLASHHTTGLPHSRKQAGNIEYFGFFLPNWRGQPQRNVVWGVSKKMPGAPREWAIRLSQRKVKMTMAGKSIPERDRILAGRIVTVLTPVLDKILDRKLKQRFTALEQQLDQRLADFEQRIMQEVTPVITAHVTQSAA